MDPAVVTRYADSRQQTNLLLEISTTPSRLFTNWPAPAGLVVAGKTYLYRPFSFEESNAVAKSTTKRTCVISLGNSDNLEGDLATNFSNKGKIVTVTKVHFNEDWSIAGTELRFYGTLVKPRLVGENVILNCNAYTGRVGPSPRTLMKNALATHTAPLTIAY